MSRLQCSLTLLGTGDIMSDSRSDAHPTYHLLLLYNCYLKEKQVRDSVWKVRDNVETALQIYEQDWPRWFQTVTFKCVREVGVPWKAGYDPDSRVPNVLLNALVLCYGPCPPVQLQVPEACNEIYRDKYARNGLLQSSVTLVRSGDALNEVFHRWPTSQICSLGLLEYQMEAFGSVRCAFASAAKALEKRVKDHIQLKNAELKAKGKGKGQSDTDKAPINNTQFERELDGSGNTLRHCQRFDSVGLLSSKLDVPLAENPLQLGLCHATEFNRIEDDCKNLSKKRKLSHLLQNACKCGKITWKTRKKGDHPLTSRYQQETIIPHFIHGYKEESMQRFFRGSVVIDATATIPELTHDDPPGKGSIVFLDDRYEGSKCDSLRHHICFIISVAAAQRVEPSTRNVGLTLKDPQKYIFRENVLKQGHFNMVASWEGVGKKAIRLHLESKVIGPVFLIVGEYVGPEYYSVALLQKKRFEIQDCLWQFVHPHSPAFPQEQEGYHNPLNRISLDAVEDAVHHKGIVLSVDQKDAIFKLINMHGLFTCLQGPPGSAKSLLLTAIFAALIGKLEKDERLLWLTMTRIQRDKALREGRQMYKDPFFAMGIGRSHTEGAKESEHGEWDPLVSQYLNYCLKPIVDTLKELTERLWKTPTTIELGTEQGNMWKADSEHMNKLSFQYYICKCEALARVHSKAKVLYFTIDGFVQAASGMSSESSYVDSFTYVYGNIDEAHQASYQKMAPVAATVKKLNLCLDQAQHIEFQKKNNSMGKSLNEEGTHLNFSWHRAVFGSSTLPAWHSLQDENTHKLQYSLRFGSIICEFLRVTCPDYDWGKSPVISPAETHLEDEFNKPDKKSVPDSKLRFVMYKNDFLYTCTQRGEMFAQTTTLANAWTQDDGVTVAGGFYTIANMYHEGLCFCKALQDGKIQLNPDHDPIILRSDTQAVVTVIYLNDVLINVDAGMLALLQMPEILKAYGLEDWQPSFSNVWIAGTPEGISGETRLLSQTAIFPNDLDGTLKGNLQCKGRRNVACSRGRILTSFHMIEECFEGNNVPKMWLHHKAFMNDYEYDPRVIVQKIDVATEGVKLAPIADRLYPGWDGEQAAWDILSAKMTAFRHIVQESIKNNSVGPRYVRASHNQVLSKMLCVTESLADQLTDDKDQSSDNETIFEDDQQPNDQTNPEFQDQEVVQQVPITQKGHIESYPLKDYPFAASIPYMDLALIPNLLRTVPVQFGSQVAQVVATVIVPPGDDKQDNTTAIRCTNLQRLIAWITYRVCNQLYDEQGNVTFTHVPHKLHYQQGRELRDCWATREALQTIRYDQKDMYAYLGGRTLHRVPFSYPLVFKDVPIKVADHLTATILYLAQAEVDQDMIAVKPEKNPKKQCDVATKMRNVRERVNSIKAILTTLKTGFPTLQDLLTQVGITPNVPTNNLNMPDITKECPVCAGSRRLVFTCRHNDREHTYPDNCPLCCSQWSFGDDL